MRNNSPFLCTIKDILWPIQKSEMKLFVPMALMMLCMLFNFGALRSLKDGLVVPAIGAEVISFLKLWFVFPTSVLFTIFYIKLSNIIRFELVFYFLITIFLIFFLLFAYVIYPNIDLYHPDYELINFYANKYLHMQWLIQIIGKWSYVLMYIFAELWSVVVINLMFWQFANHIFDTEKAKRFYPLLGVIGNMGLIIAGNTLIISANIGTLQNHYDIGCHIMFQYIILAITFSGIISMLLFYVINKFVLSANNLHKNLYKINGDTQTKLSVADSIKLIIHSHYIRCIVMIVICYGFVINILEGPWKAKIKELYPNTISYVHFMGNFNIWMGCSCIGFMVIGSNIVRRCRWISAALVTPTMILITGMVFFMFIIFSNRVDSVNFNPIYAAVIVGAMQNILSKSTKYSLFDSTKEMAYIPLSVELRTKGKATAEIIGLKFGKSFGAFTQSIIFMLIPSTNFDNIAIYLMCGFIIMISFWFKNVITLNKKYLNLTQTTSPL